MLTITKDKYLTMFLSFQLLQQVHTLRTTNPCARCLVVSMQSRRILDVSNASTDGFVHLLQSENTYGHWTIFNAGALQTIIVAMEDS